MIKKLLIKQLERLHFEPEIDALNTFKQKIEINFNDTIYETDISAIIIFEDSDEWQCKLMIEYNHFEISAIFPIYRHNEIQMGIFKYWYNELIEIIRHIWGLLL